MMIEDSDDDDDNSNLIIIRLKTNILQEVALFNILAEHGGFRGVNLEKIPQSKVCTAVLRDCRRICDGG
jgi:hypothetical protein